MLWKQATQPTQWIQSLPEFARSWPSSFASELQACQRHRENIPVPVQRRMHKSIELLHRNRLRHRHHERAALARENQKLSVRRQRGCAFVGDSVHAVLQVLCLCPLPIYAVAEINIAPRIRESAFTQRIEASPKRWPAFTGRHKKQHRLVGIHKRFKVIEL